MIPGVDMGNLYVYFDTSKKLDLNQLGNRTVLYFHDSVGTYNGAFNLDDSPFEGKATKLLYIDYERGATYDVYDATTETWMLSKIKINFDTAIIGFNGGNDEAIYIAAGLDTAMFVDSEITIHFGNEEYTQITKSSERPQTIINGETKNNMFLEDIQDIELVTTVEEI